MTTFGNGALTPAETGKDAASNPALSPKEKLLADAARRGRVPMSGGRTKMSTPDVPGHHLHWLNDEEARIQQALQGGYLFVEKSEVNVNNFDLAGDSVGEGTDLGSRVSMYVGTNKQGLPMRAYLMKIPNELYSEDQAAIQARVDATHEVINRGALDTGDTPEDRRQRYVSRASTQSTYSRRST